MNNNDRKKQRRVYFLVSGDQLATLMPEEPQEEPLGPLGDDLPEHEPAPAPGYAPRRKEKPGGAPRGFFLDRYVY